MMMPILKVVQELESKAQEAGRVFGFQFQQVCLTAARYLVMQGEELFDQQQGVPRETDKIVSVEGYKAFHGTMRIRPKTASVPSFELTGDWLYKPETDCWYGKGSSFASDICRIVEVM